MTTGSDLRRAFPEVVLVARGPAPANLAPRQTLKVHAVGDFEASFVPTVGDFERLDERFRREGAGVTVLAYGTMVHVAEAAAAETGIDAEVIDLRTLLPLDLETIVESVAKTGRCVIVHEATMTSGYGAELAALVQEHCFYHLEAPVARVTGWDTPYPHAQEWDYFPGPARVGRALLEAMEA